ncbi:hypothetical protein ACWKWA_12105 [Dermacoccus abyssi]
MNALLLTTLTRFAHLPITHVTYTAPDTAEAAHALTITVGTCAAFHAAVNAVDATIQDGEAPGQVATAGPVRIEHACHPAVTSTAHASNPQASSQAPCEPWAYFARTAREPARDHRASTSAYLSA